MKSSTQLPTTTFWRTAAIIVGAAIAAHALLWLEAPLWSQFIAALLITAWLPGFVLARLLLGAPANEFDWLELPLFAVGAGFGVQVVGMTLLSYLPGGIAPWQILLTFDGVTLALLATSWWLERTRRGTAPQVAAPAGGRRLWLAVVAVVLVGATLRFTDLGYSEFHTDEARILVLMAQVGEGYPNALMANYKGAGAGGDPRRGVAPGGAHRRGDRAAALCRRQPGRAAGDAGAGLAALWRRRGRQRGAADGGERLHDRVQPLLAVPEHRLSGERVGDPAPLAGAARRGAWGHNRAGAPAHAGVIPLCHQPACPL
jgi:hypothetical protein